MKKLKMASFNFPLALAQGRFARAQKILRDDPASLLAVWTQMTPLEQAACWRLLPARAVPAFFRQLPPSSRWLMYLAQDVSCLAPLLEGRPERLRKLFRRTSTRELEKLRLVSCS